MSTRNLRVVRNRSELSAPADTRSSISANGCVRDEGGTSIGDTAVAAAGDGDRSGSTGADSGRWSSGAEDDGVRSAAVLLRTLSALSLATECRFEPALLTERLLSVPFSSRSSELRRAFSCICSFSSHMTSSNLDEPSSSDPRRLGRSVVISMPMPRVSLKMLSVLSTRRSLASDRFRRNCSGSCCCCSCMSEGFRDPEHDGERSKQLDEPPLQLLSDGSHLTRLPGRSSISSKVAARAGSLSIAVFGSLLMASIAEDEFPLVMRSRAWRPLSRRSWSSLCFTFFSGMARLMVVRLAMRSWPPVCDNVWRPWSVKALPFMPSIMARKLGSSWIDSSSDFQIVLLSAMAMRFSSRYSLLLRALYVRGVSSSSSLLSS